MSCARVVKIRTWLPFCFPANRLDRNAHEKPVFGCVREGCRNRDVDQRTYAYHRIRATPVEHNTFKGRPRSMPKRFQNPSISFTLILLERGASPLSYLGFACHALYNTIRQFVSQLLRATRFQNKTMWFSCMRGHKLQRGIEVRFAREGALANDRCAFRMT